MAGCTEPYIPELKDNGAEKTLIIEGYINADGNSEYTLGYIAPLYQTVDSSYTVVSNARLSVEEENGEAFTDFSYEGSSRYVIRHPALRLNSRYRLRITIGSREYLSDFVPVLVSPEIERINWKQDIQEGVRFYLDTKRSDQAYYRWEFEETWQFRTPQRSLFLFDGYEVVTRTEEERFPATCYISEKSRGIYLHTTEAQEENTIKDFNVHFIPNFSEKLDMRYSILVKQYALSKESFGYWSLVRKNSEEIGDIFGTLPTELTGNIFCVSHPEEKVVGMIEAGRISEKRIFVNYLDFPIPWAQKYEYYAACATAETIPLRDVKQIFRRKPELYSGR
ncbi:MAG: DUF4249 domain-containing protein [Leadbetterella sp.]|nr:DUF4249 domain-containing protein [Leadbetterella sp.]